jgi:transposase
VIAAAIPDAMLLPTDECFASAMSPDLNTIEHIWDMLGRRIHAREPPVQNIRQLEAALHREWQQLSQQDI